MSLLKWLEHKTNSLHVWCRLLDMLLRYDRLWKQVFNHKHERRPLTRGELLTVSRLHEKKRLLEEEQRCLLKGEKK